METSTGGGEPVKGVRAAERLLADMRSEIGRADTKASVLIGAIGVCVGAVAGGVGKPSGAGGPGAVLWWAGGVAWALALGFLMFAAAPRYRRSAWEPGGPLSYFLDIRRASRSGRLPEALRSAEDDPLPGLVTALSDTSGIVAAKHRWIRVGIGCFALGAVLLSAAVVAG